MPTYDTREVEAVYIAGQLLGPQHEYTIKYEREYFLARVESYDVYRYLDEVYLFDGIRRYWCSNQSTPSRHEPIMRGLLAYHRRHVERATG